MSGKAMKRLQNTGCSLAICLLACVAHLYAQPIGVEPSGAPGAAPAQKTPAASIDEIPQRIEESSTILRRATANAAPQPAVEEIERELPNFVQGSRWLLAFTRKTMNTPRSTGVVREVESAWNVPRKRLDVWQAILRGRSGALQRDVVALRQQDEWWAGIGENAEAEQLPAELQSEIRLLRKSIQQAEGAVTKRRNDVLRLQARVSELEMELDRLSEELAAAEAASRGRLFRLDGPPLWRPAQPVLAPAPTAEPDAATSTAVNAMLEYYLRSLETVLLALAGLFGGLLLLLLLARRRLGPREDEGPWRALRPMMARPYSLAILLSVLAASLGLLNLPQSLMGVAWLLMLIPLLRIAALVLPRDAKPALWVLAFAYIVDGALGLLPIYWAGARIMALALGVTALGGIWWLGRQIRTRYTEPGDRKLILAGARLGGVLLLLALAAEIAGAVALSRFLFGAVLKTFYSAVVLFGLLHPLREGIGGVESGALNRWLRPGVDWLFAVLFAVLTMRSFLLERPILEGASRILNYKLSIGAIEFTLAAVVVFLAVVAAAMLLSRLVRSFLAPRVFHRMEVARGTGEAVSRLMHYAFLTVGFLLGLAAAGIELSRFAVLAGGMGVGLAFGLQTIVNNFVSGLILLFERPVHVGDKVTVGSTSGEVVDIGIRASTIRTWDGGDVVIPNASLITGDFTNWTLTDDKRRVELAVGVAYGTDPAVAIRILTETASAHGKVLPSPPPNAIFKAFGDSSLDFVLYCWTRLNSHQEVSSDLHVAVYRALNRAGIEIPFPQREVNLKGGQAPDTELRKTDSIAEESTPS